MRVVRVGEDAVRARVEAFVEGRARAVTDLPAWHRVVREAYGMPTHVLAAMEGDAVVGALCLVEGKHPALGHSLLTAAFGNDGGLHVDGEAERDGLVAEARVLADELGVAHAVIRARAEIPGLVLDRHYESALLDIAGGSQAVWERLPAKTRNQVRRGQKEGFAIASGREQMRPFFDVFHEHMRALGSPAHSRRYYECIALHLGDAVDFIVVRDGAELVAGALLTRTNGVAMNLHTVSLRRFNTRCPNYLIYWDMIERSVAAGCHSLDMGRSVVDSPNMRFKRNWNPAVLPLAYNFILREGTTPPYVDPRNPKYALAIATWKRLPLAVTRRLGPMLMPGLA